ncbi:glycoside hydrolase family 5 protein [Ideonella sp. B508-1]|uniref:glycoside hydrolase family 5 protein n=1 Tax=Ideonella sp. B508-1 TaxID=137716 RepID=UPI0003B59C1F|nr:cellulase family glycosylhydrolase [Ideonella sp. B508-1]
MRRVSVLLLLLCGLQFSVMRGAEGACASPIRGINLVPLPTGWVNGKVANQFPGEEHIIYYKSVGFNAIRLPITWESAQPALMGSLDSAYLNDLKQFLAKAEAQGMPVMVEVHNYDRYQGKLIGSPEVPVSAFQDLWRRLAGALKDQKMSMATA